MKQGDVVGILGHNGAGKSTLLKIISRITMPSKGCIHLRGRISSLLEVGTGFHPELTGKENIYMNGTILGMSKREIDGKFDEIVEFSGVEKFLYTPVKRYSSGMQVRLAFAVAAHLEPEVLVVDEVLAVGDLSFQKKCLGKMEHVASSGRTVLFVSHNMAAIESLCSRGILLRDGGVVVDSDIASAVSHYREMSSPSAQGASCSQSSIIRSVEVVDESGEPTQYIPAGTDFTVRLSICPESQLRSPQIGIAINSISGERMMTLHTPLSSDVIGNIASPCKVQCRVSQFPLAPGAYSLIAAIAIGGESLARIEDVCRFDVIDADLFGEGRGHLRGRCVAPSTWSVEQ
ncbi:MAG: ABC transporter ATP-binding protein [Planctomycetales bacterium]|nr:ABC transporter ATP-binding protein [Planctomycetales bacterium]